jgi:cytochrome P450
METLRLYPPVPVYERQAMQPIALGSHHIPAGAYVGIFPWALHHRATLYPDPEHFDPDRFTDAAIRARHRYAWIPFGAGARICIGNHFALQEGPLILACIAARTRLERLDPTPVRPDPQAATLRPLGAIRMRVHTLRDDHQTRLTP